MSALSCLVGLLLLVDVSASVNDARYDLQRNGTKQAFQNKEVQEIILKNSPMAVSIIEWSSPISIKTTLKWTIINNQEDLNNLVNKITEGNRTSSGITALNHAVRTGINYFDRSPCQMDRKIIDISGDGPNNFGMDEEKEDNKKIAEEKGITINGLPIEAKTPYGVFNEGIEEYYRTIITYDGFVIPATMETFIESLRKKLIMEISLNNVKFRYN